MTRNLLLVVPFLLINTGLLGAEEWPAISAREWSLTSVPEYPNASAVVLLERGKLVLDERSISSYLQVYRRIKILTEEGLEHGSVSLYSSDSLRMKRLEARTHRRDRQVVELGKDAVFKKEYSAYYDRTITSFAMPEVEVGAIIEYRYQLFFDSVVFVSPWYFSSALPILNSEISCTVPPGFSLFPYKVETLSDRHIREQVQQQAWGLELTYSMTNMPPVPDEPLRFPFAVMATRLTFLPVTYPSSTGPIALLESWKSAIRLVKGTSAYGYERFRSRASAVKSKTKSLITGLGKQQDKARVLYRFVRDQIITEPVTGVWAGDNHAAEVLDNGRGDLAEKALLLQCMLERAKLDASIGWTNGTHRALINPKVPDLGQVDTPLVVVTLDNHHVFLDPSDRTLTFGALPPRLEGSPCLLVDTKKPVWVETPVTPANESVQQAQLTLDLDEEGRLAGAGSLVLTGHAAWQHLGVEDTLANAIKAWQEWLEDSFVGFDISELEVDEDIEQQRITLSWSQQQRDEEVLGDEASVLLAAPLNHVDNPFTLPVGQRQSPVLLPFAFVTSVQLLLRWDEGWMVDLRPQLRGLDNTAGRLSSTLTLDKEQRQLSYSRRFEVRSREFIGQTAYRELRELYQAVVTHDAETLELIRQ